MSFNSYVNDSDRPPKTLDKMKLQRFMLSLPSFDNQRLIFHAARQTLRKAEMARVAVREWLNQHDCELEEWKTKKASELGISISRLEQKLLAAAQHQSITNKENDNPNSEEDS
ncbi:hypothetical protein [Nostoc sp.]|uniref:hypothetical protein n=1 Tax=Nostoc sp. TaxID=1180 RepID=UPI002FF931D8